MARVVALSRWDADTVQKIRGVPGKLITHTIAHAEFSHLEEHAEPHVDADAVDRSRVDLEEVEGRRRADDIRITMRDLRLYGYHPGRCPRCEDIQQGVQRSWKNHSPAWRDRLYQAIRDANDQRHKHLLEPRGAAVRADVHAEAEDLNLKDSAAG